MNNYDQKSCFEAIRLYQNNAYQGEDDGEKKPFYNIMKPWLDDAIRKSEKALRQQPAIKIIPKKDNKLSAAQRLILEKFSDKWVEDNNDMLWEMRDLIDKIAFFNEMYGTNFQLTLV